MAYISSKNISFITGCHQATITTASSLVALVEKAGSIKIPTIKSVLTIPPTFSKSESRKYLKSLGLKIAQVDKIGSCIYSAA